jgi:glycosyltransferase involved in cell wall biosynthesis
VSKLALCVPAYNAAQHLPRLLRSALSQTIRFDEVLVYNDCSTDATALVAAQHGARVINGHVNRGCSFGKNKLAELTACEWIHFHDADDDLHPTFVEEARKWIAAANAPDVVLFGYEYRDNETNRLFAVQRYDDAELRRDPVSYAIKQKIVTICGIYRRSSFLNAGGFDTDENVLYNEDVAMHCRLARAGLTFAADPSVTVVNYFMSQSMSQSNQIKCARAHYHVLKKAAEESNGNHHDELAEKLWQAAAVSATYLDWQTADLAAELAVKLKGRTPATAGLLFKSLCSVDPWLALRAREYLIRLLKPRFRKNTPRYAGP